MHASTLTRAVRKATSRVAVCVRPVGNALPESAQIPALRSRRAGRGRTAQSGCGRCAGFGYIGVLMLVAMMGIALAVVAQMWQTAQKRDKEEELLFVGNQFRRALAMYAAGGSSYPRSLEDLLKDPRSPAARRFLRKIYRDPITGRAQWGLLKPDGNAIVGVYSLSDAVPLKQGGFSLADRGFEGKKKYSEWVFTSAAGLGSSANPTGAGSVTPQASAPQFADPHASTPPASAPQAVGTQQPGITQPGAAQDGSLPFPGGRPGFRARR